MQVAATALGVAYTLVMGLVLMCVLCCRCGGGCMHLLCAAS